MSKTKNRQQLDILHYATLKCQHRYSLSTIGLLLSLVTVFFRGLPCLIDCSNWSLAWTGLPFLPPPPNAGNPASGGGGGGPDSELVIGGGGGGGGGNGMPISFTLLLLCASVKTKQTGQWTDEGQWSRGDSTYIWRSSCVRSRPRLKGQCRGRTLSTVWGRGERLSHAVGGVPFHPGRQRSRWRNACDEWLTAAATQWRNGDLPLVSRVLDCCCSVVLLIIDGVSTGSSRDCRGRRSSSSSSPSSFPRGIRAYSVWH